MHDVGERVAAKERHWLVTGSAGFIGSHLVEALLRLGQRVTSLDNFSTGYRANLELVRASVGEAAWQRHRLIEGDIVEAGACAQACAGVDIVLHEAALGSVPRSIEDPLATHRSNVTGFLTLLVAARDAGVRRFVYAASSSTYGDSAALPKVEDVIGRPLSPYAVTKYVNELYADVFFRSYGLQTIGLRYFNVFGARQDPSGAYAAVIPIWARSIVEGRACVIHGDGATSRDFCHVDNVVQANLRAALVQAPAALGQVYNIALGNRTTLLELHAQLAAAIRSIDPTVAPMPPEHGPARAGDIRHSLADISKATRLLGYAPTHSVQAGLLQAARWYVAALGGERGGPAG